MEVDSLTYRVIECAMTVHKALGPGLLESAYRNCHCHEMRRQGLFVEMEKSLPLTYDGVRTRKGYRIDLLVEKLVVVEVKAEKYMHPVEISQVQTYLELLDLDVGLIINFNVRWLKEGVRRVIRARHPRT